MPEPTERSSEAPGPGSSPPPDPAPQQAQFEVIPLPGVLERVLEHLDPGTRVTVTASPAQGLDATIGTAIALARAGRIAVPHLAGRMVPGARELEALLDRLGEEGIDQLLVLDIKDADYFQAGGAPSQHGGGNPLARDPEIMGWLFAQR